MKRVIFFLSIFLLFPVGIFAYSDKVIVGGENIGITINSKGIIVVGFYKINNKNIQKDLKIGDKLLKINNKEINNINDLKKELDSNKDKVYLDILIKRNNKERYSKLYLYKKGNKVKTGIYFKDGISGIGTISYIDPSTGIYGALGHEVIEEKTEELIDVKNGNIYSSIVKDIDRSIDGYPGSKEAIILYSKKIGNVEKNTLNGIYGKVNKIPNKDLVDVANFEDIKEDEAYIYTTLSDNKINKYKIEIEKVDKDNKNTSKAFSFRIKDKELLSKTGGVIQGMSGSPIIQNNKIIGAVTHVVVDDVDKGYGIFIKSMLKTGES